MREFFHGWRRKMGLVTLAIALTVFGAWMRSCVQIDFYEITVGDREHAFGSYHGYLSWRSWDGTFGRSAGWQSLPASLIPAEKFLDLESESVASSHPRQWLIPHAWVVAAMTLLSAYLILWKPRKRMNRDA